MDIASFLGSVGINTGPVVAVWMMTQVIKLMDKKNVLAKFYVLIPLVLGMIAGILLAQPFTLQQAALQGFIYAAASSYAANFIRMFGTIPGDPSHGQG